MPKNIPTPRWDAFVKEVLHDRAIMFVDGRKPDKIIHVLTFKEAGRAAKMLAKLKIRQWVLFSVEKYGRDVVLMSTAMLIRDLEAVTEKKPKIYTQDKASYLDGAFPDLARPDVFEIKAFYNLATS